MLPQRPQTAARDGAPDAGHGSMMRALPAVLAAIFVLSACDAGTGEVGAQESWETDFSKHTVPLDEIVSGGPPKDGIPSIDEPKFTTIRDAEGWLGDREPVAVVEQNGVVKAYPLQILIHHEIVNDVVGGRPVSVTYCPLCNTTLAFDRRFEGMLLDFGTTGRLRHSDLVMYDRQTETWWQQATGEGIVGEHAGAQLDFVSAPVLSWDEVKEQFPDAQVLSRDTGYMRNYGQNPYAGYDSGGPFSRFFQGDVDDKLPQMERIAAIDRGGESMAVPFSRLQENPVAHVEVGGDDLVVFWVPGTASAVDRSRIAEGRDVGSTGVFRRTVDGRELTFEPVEGRPDRFRDQETGSLWTIAGKAVEGPMAGDSIAVVPHGNHFWFAWAVFKPETEVWGG